MFNYIRKNISIHRALSLSLIISASILCLIYFHRLQFELEQINNRINSAQDIMLKVIDLGISTERLNAPTKDLFTSKHLQYQKNQYLDYQNQFDVHFAILKEAILKDSDRIQYFSELHGHFQLLIEKKTQHDLLAQKIFHDFSFSKMSISHSRLLELEQIYLEMKESLVALKKNLSETTAQLSIESDAKNRSIKKQITTLLILIISFFSYLLLFILKNDKKSQHYQQKKINSEDNEQRIIDYENIFQVKGLGSFVMTDHESFLASPTCSELIGCSFQVHQNCYKSLMAAVHDDDRQILTQFINESFKNSDSRSSALIRIRDQNRRWRSLQFDSQFRSTNASTYVTGLVQDMTSSLEISDLNQRIQTFGEIGGWSFDVQSEIVFLTENARRLLNLKNQNSHYSLTDLSSVFIKKMGFINEVIQQCHRAKRAEAILELLNPDGSTYWIRAIGEPISDDSGNIMILKGSFQNVTEQVTLQKDRERQFRDLLASQSRLTTLIEGLPFGFYECEHSLSRSLKFTTPHFHLITGYESTNKDFPHSSHLNEMICAEDREHVISQIEFAKNQGQAYSLQYRLRTKGGEVIWVWDTGAYSQNLNLFTGALIEITKNKQTEIQLNLKKQIIEHFFEFANEAICILDSDFRIKTFNESFGKIFAHKVKNLSGQNFLELISDGEASYGLDPKLTIDSNQRFSMILNISITGQNSKIYRLNGTKNQNLGQYSMTLTDITQEESFQYQLKKTHEAIDTMALMLKFSQSGTLIEANQNFCNLMKISLLDLKQIKLETLCFEESDRFAIRSSVKDASLDFNTVFKLTLKSSDEQLVTMQATVVKINHDSKSQSEFLLFGFNQTEEVQLIRQAEEAQKIAAIGNWSYKSGTETLYWSRQMYRIFSVPHEEGPLSLSKFKAHIFEFDRELWHDHIQACLDLGTAFSFRCRSHSLNNTQWIEFHAQPTYNGIGLITGINGTCQDITERVQSQAEYQSILDALNVGTWKYHLASNKLILDQRAQSLLTLSEANEDQTEAFEKLIQPEELKLLKNNLKASISAKRPIRGHLKVQLNTQSTQHFGYQGFSEASAFHQKIISGIIWNITEEVQTQNIMDLQKEKMIHDSKLLAIGELSAGLAHEVNNPLAIILTNASILERYRTDSEKFNQKIRIISEAVARIKEIVLSLKRFSSTETRVQFKNEKLLTLFKNIDSFVNLKCRELGINICVEIDPNLSIFCDTLAIEQVLLCLIKNSIEALERSQERWIRVTTFVVDQELKLIIKDSGPGIKIEFRDKIFQPFFTTKEIGSGTGLGLSVVKGILKQHEALIELVSSEAHTTFEITFKKWDINQNAA